MFGSNLLTWLFKLYDTKSDQVYIVPPKAERSEVTNRVVFGLITWFASPGESSREFVYIYVYIFKVYVRGHVAYPPRYGVHQVLSH